MRFTARLSATLEISAIHDHFVRGSRRGLFVSPLNFFPLSDVPGGIAHVFGETLRAPAWTISEADRSSGWQRMHRATFLSSTLVGTPRWDCGVGPESFYGIYRFDVDRITEDDTQQTYGCEATRIRSVQIALADVEQLADGQPQNPGQLQSFQLHHRGQVTRVPFDHREQRFEPICCRGLDIRISLVYNAAANRSCVGSRGR